MARRTAPDDTPLYVVKRDLSGGQNTRQFEQIIQDNQAVKLQNILLETAGARSLRSGKTDIDDTYPAVFCMASNSNCPPSGSKPNKHTPVPETAG